MTKRKPAIGLEPFQDSTSPAPQHHASDPTAQLAPIDSRDPPHPLYQLQLKHLTHDGTKIFLDALTNIPVQNIDVNIVTLLEKTFAKVLHLLYDVPLPHHDPAAATATPTPTPASTANPPWPSVRSVLLCLEHMDGVAYTIGRGAGGADKEIHMSLKYIVDTFERFDKPSPPEPQTDSTQTRGTVHEPDAAASAPSALPQLESQKPPGDGWWPSPPPPILIHNEIHGVVQHEMVHTVQHNLNGSAPSYIIEGIADWVRLNTGLGALHWRRRGPKEVGDRGFANGYSDTAYFLDWMEKERGVKVSAVNRALDGRGTAARWDEEGFWRRLLGGKTVGELWAEYGVWLEGRKS